LREQYTSYQECVDFFKSAADNNPDLFRVESIGKTWEERDILAVSISLGMDDVDTKPAMFYTGTIHAREWIGIELSLAFAKYILDHIDYDPQLKQILSRTTLYMVPCANPDGFEFSRTHFSFWRKNRRQNADGTFGVDLNRNFSIGFSPNKDTSSNVYSGPSAFSEPETRALKNFTEDHSNITIALDYHSQGNVFFPAHNFIHEDATNATDLNLLAGNMAEEIRKVSGREYGIHMGKPPTHLISGSGREFYYSQGALSIVVEVGTRNISDYKENMVESINENIPALIFALDEVSNYNKETRLPVVKNFVSPRVEAKEVELTWDYPSDETVYFEIYRSTQVKGYAQSSNRIGMTKMHTFIDNHLNPAKNYYYFIRAVCKTRHIKSPFAFRLGVRTNPDYNQFSKILFPNPDNVGYVGEKTQKNREHFGENSLFVGVSEKKGVAYGVTGFSLESIPENAIITEARISYYPMNRVAVQVERYGQWRIGVMDERSIDDISSFDDIKNAKILGYVGRPTRSQQLAQGVWRKYQFATQEIDLLQDAVKRRNIFFRMEGPDELPLDRASQMMQWDIGYGRFSGGLTFRPKLEVVYSLQEVHIEILSQSECSISKEHEDEDSLVVGFDNNGNRRFGCIDFDMTQMPDIDNTIISSAHIEIKADTINSNANLRYHLELVRGSDTKKDYEHIKHRDVVERIGYDVSTIALKSEKQQRFLIDRHAIGEIVNKVKAGAKLSFVLSASSEKPLCKSQSINFLDEKRNARPILHINYIKKRRNPVAKVTNLKFTLDGIKIKLTWDNPEDSAFKGVIVVKNAFRVPCSPYDGQKLYGGSDNYTYDSFGSRNAHKFYAVFTYDDVPNFSEAAYIEHKVD